MTLEDEKQLAANCAAQMVHDGMRVGLGSGSTVTYLLDELARRNPDVIYVASSPTTEKRARALGLKVTDFYELSELDIAIDGADQIAPDGWLVKGGGAALTREKIIACSSARFVVIADSSKLVDALHPPLPLELLKFGIAATSLRIGPLSLRDVAPSPDHGVIGDYLGEVNPPSALAGRLSNIAGVIEHGLFEPALIDEILVGVSGEVRHIYPGGK